MVYIISFIATDASAQPTGREYHVKAGFIYNFVRFIEWPGNTFEKISLCIASDRHNDVFFSLNNKIVRGKKLEVKECGWDCCCPTSEQNSESILSELKKIIPKLRNKTDACGCEESDVCHILFIDSRDRRFIQERLERIKNQRVLTVGEAKGFIEMGGIIGFFTDQKKLRYEVNLYPAKQSGLKLRYKLLKSAARVIDRPGRVDQFKRMDRPDRMGRKDRHRKVGQPKGKDRHDTDQPGRGYR